MPTSPPPYSASRAAAGLIFVSGQLGRGADGRYAEGVGSQTAQALRNVEAALSEHGVTLSDVVKCQVFLSSIADWSSMNDEYVRWFDEPYPSRSAVGCALVPGALVEIEAIARAV